MDTGILSGLVGGLVSVVLMTYLVRAAQRADTQGELRFGAPLLVLAVACLAFTLLAVWAFFYDADAREVPSEMFAIVGLFVGFGAGTVYCFGEYFGVRGRFDAQGIAFRTPWTGAREERWEDLESLRFNQSMYWYELRFRSGRLIRVSALLRGHGELLKFLADRGHPLS